jgi:putative nucleotidyltransferase with HDIG domain
MNGSGEGNASRGDKKVDALKAFVASVQHLPLFTGTAMQLIRTVDQEDVTVGELSRLISTDAALVAHLLRIVNSPYYGLARRIGTVSDALTVLGFNLVRRTVTAAVLQRPLFAYLHETSVARAFWRHGLMCASLARHLAMQKNVDGELAYMAGLMHDVGRLAMLMQFPEQTDVLLRVHSDDDNFGIDREFARFGFDHAQVGGALLELWGLPEKIVQAAHQHADETEPEDPMSASVWRGNMLSHEMIDEPDEDEELRPWMVAIGLSVKAKRQIMIEILALESDQG